MLEEQTNLSCTGKRLQSRSLFFHYSPNVMHLVWPTTAGTEVSFGFTNQRFTVSRDTFT